MWGLWVVDWQVFSQTLENIFLMRGCLQWHPHISTSSSLLSDLYSRIPQHWFKEMGTEKHGFSVGDNRKSFRLIFTLPSLPGLSRRQYRNETGLNLQRTKEYIPRIPLGRATLHTGNSSVVYLCELTTNIILMSFYQIWNAPDLQVLYPHQT